MVKVITWQGLLRDKKKKKCICYGRLHTLNQNERLKHRNIYERTGGFRLPNCAINMHAHISSDEHTPFILCSTI